MNTELQLYDAIIDPYTKEVSLFITDLSEEWLLQNEVYELIDNGGHLIYREVK